ncbi:MAG TPA: Ig-like domain-containing protein [Pseudolabrys sp.]
MRSILILTVLLCGFADLAEANCTVPRWRFIWDVETNGYMTTDGAPCRMRLVRVGRTGEIHSVKIASPPRNGAASASGHLVNYKPKAGFKGEDSFVFAIDGRRNGSPVHATVRVSVTAQ